MSDTTDNSDTTIPSNIHRFPRKPRFTEQDVEDHSDARRYLTLNGAVKHLAQMQQDLRAVFQEALQSAGPWPFHALRHFQSYIEKDEFTLLTHSSQVLESAIVQAQAEISQRTVGLTRALFGRTDETMGAHSGFDLKQDSRLLHEVERTLAQIRELIDETADSKAHDDLESASRMTDYSLRSMYEHGGKIPEFGKAKLRAVSEPPMEGYNPERRKLLHIAEHWTGLSNSEIKLMKLALVADYTAAGNHRGPRQQVEYKGQLVLATPDQGVFVKADAQAHRDLGVANKTLYQALTH